MNIELKERSRDDLLEIISAKDMKITMQKIEIEEQQQEIERLNNLLKETSQTLSEQTTKAITLKSENKRLNIIINRIKSVYSSLCFSAPENNYIFIEQLGEVLQEIKGEDKE